MKNRGALSFLIEGKEETPMSYYRNTSDSSRTEVTKLSRMRKHHDARILLVDDDPVFCKIVERAASSHGLNITVMGGPTQLDRLKTDEFDVAIIDFHLGLLNAYDLASYMARLNLSTPIIMVSHTDGLVPQNWPSNIREFINKKLGPAAILDAALETYEIQSRKPV